MVNTNFKYSALLIAYVSKVTYCYIDSSARVEGKISHFSANASFRQKSVRARMGGAQSHLVLVRQIPLVGRALLENCEPGLAHRIVLSQSVCGNWIDCAFTH
jgi:hypothetical protein